MQSAADLVCSRGGDNAGKRTSIFAHPPPFLVHPAKFLGEGRCYLPPTSLAGAQLLRRATRGSGLAGVAAVPGVRPLTAWPNPPVGPLHAAVYQHRQPADDSASSGCAPASSWRLGIATVTAATTDTLGRMLPQNAEGSGAPVRMAPQAEGRFPGQGICFPSFQACSAPASGEVCGAGKASLHLRHAMGSS